MASQTDFEKFLVRFETGDIAGADQVISVSAAAKCPEVLQTMIEKQIQSVPVYDDEKKEYVGFVDVLDFVAMVVTMNHGKELIDVLSHREVPYQEFFEQEGKVYSEQDISDVCNASERNPWCAVYSGVPLHSLMDMFGKDVNIHRVPIVDGEGNVKSIVSQSKIIAFLAREVPAFESVANKKIGEVWKASRELVSVPITSTAQSAFTILLQNKVSGVAVVDENGVLEGALSASDIKGSLGNAVFSDLRKPLTEYLHLSSKYYNRENSMHPVSCTVDCTVAEVLAKLDKNHVHRVFVVDADKKPVGVVSLCDIISALSLHFRLE